MVVMKEIVSFCSHSFKTKIMTIVHDTAVLLLNRSKQKNRFDGNQIEYFMAWQNENKRGKI